MAEGCLGIEWKRWDGGGRRHGLPADMSSRGSHHQQTLPIIAEFQPLPL